MSATAPAPPTGSTLASVTASLYASGKYSDLCIKCQGRSFKVHQALICSQSKVLAAAIDGYFKEAHTREIDLDDSEPDIVANMLKFLYTHDYDDGRSNDSATPQLSSALSTNVKVYVMGDRYDIQPLKALATKKYEEVAEETWDTQYFPASLRLLYEQTLDSDRLLKETALKVAAFHAKDLLNRGEFVALCKESGDIAIDVLKFAIMSEPKPCPPCPGAYCGSGNVHVRANNNPHKVAGNSFRPGSSATNARFYCASCSHNFN